MNLLQWKLVATTGYWAWWQGALALTVVALGFACTENSLLGVSGRFSQLLESGRGRLDAGIFLLAMLGGAWLAAPSSPKAAASVDLLFSSPLLGALALLVGGVLVGFGTRVAGGCTSGHGLCGCARGNPASLLATFVFFGSAIVVSLLLGGRS